MSARVLLLDIETAPTLAWVWSAYQTNIIGIEKDWYLLTYAWKWLGEKETYVADFTEVDEHIFVKNLWCLFDEADVIIAHHGDKFDIKKCNAMFLRHGLLAPTPYKTIDTKKIAKKYFMLDINSLDDISRYLGLGRKINTGGFELWKGCMARDPEAIAKMREYNVHDVILLERVYLILRTWHVGHPNLLLYADTQREACPTCQSDHVQKRGFTVLKVQKRQRWNCQDCGAWFSGKIVK